MTGFFDAPFYHSLLFMKLIRNTRIFSSIVFALGSISIISYLLFNSPRIPGDFVLFQIGLMSFSIYFMYSSFKGGLVRSERVFYAWMSFIMISVIFFMMHWPGSHLFLVINFFGLIFLSLFTVLNRSFPIKFPHQDAMLIFTILVTIVLFSFLTPRMVENYRIMDLEYEQRS